MRRGRALITTTASAVAALLVSAGIASAGTVSLWHMDEKSGTTMVDSVGSNDGTLQNIALGQPGFLKTAYGFDGVDSLVTGPSGGLNAGSSPFWYGARIRFPSAPDATVGDYDLMRKGLSSEPGGFWKIEIFGSGQLHCEMKGSSSSAALTAGPDIADDHWHSVFCLKDNKTMRVIVDGKVVGTSTVTLGSFSNAAVLAIGGKAEGGDQYAGLMDEATFGTGATITNSQAPAVSGTPAIGATLSATSGRWDGMPDIATSLQWQRCDGGGGACAAIAGATQATYKVTDADAGSTLRVFVTAKNPVDQESAFSAATGVVPVPVTETPPPPSDTTPPPTTPPPSATPALVVDTTPAPVVQSGPPPVTPVAGASCLQLTASKSLRRATLAGGKTITLRFDGGADTVTFRAPKSTVRSVTFTLDGHRIATKRGGSLHRVLDAAKLGAGSHVLKAIIHPRHGAPRTLTLRVTVSGC